MIGGGYGNRNYRIERKWTWGPSYLCAASACFISILAAIAAFCSTYEALLCDSDPYLACKLCLTCAKKPHETEVKQFVMPRLPSEGLAAQGASDFATSAEAQQAEKLARQKRFQANGLNNNAVQLPPLR